MRSHRTRIVGQSKARVDAPDKTSGRAKYVDDIVMPRLLHARTIRSPVARGVLRSWRIKKRPTGLVVVDHRDIKGQNVIASLVDDQPCLVVDRIEHREEPILLLAHEDRDVLNAVVVELEIDELEPCFDPVRSTRELKRIEIVKGDAIRALGEADLVIEGEYATSHQEQLYIEPNGMIAVPEDDGITVIGSLQCPYYVHTALVRLLDSEPSRVRVVQAETGGGFGGKEEFPSIVAGHAALLARKAKRPVKLVYDRHEDLVASTKRHPSIVRHRTGLRRDGTLVAMDIDVLFDGGAYTTLSPVVLSRGCIHAAGPYRCEHVRVLGRAVATNTPPNGAFRGFGAPQTLFAIEAHMDRIATTLGIDPVRLREKNALRAGDTTATGQVMGKDTSALAVLREAVRRSGYHTKKRQTSSNRDVTRGIGVSLFFHGSGFTGSGEAKLKSRATLEIVGSRARIHVGSSEIGQGTRTMLSQMVAEALGWPLSRVDVAAVDTAAVPDSGPTVASRTCLIVGGILVRAATALRASLHEAKRKRASKADRGERLSLTMEYEKPPSIEWDDEHYRGSAYAAYAFGCNVAEIEVDRGTGRVRPVRFTAALDVGCAVNPNLVRGQIEGGVVQGIGYALYEEVVMERGVMKNAQLTNYIIPTTLDIPEIDVAILEFPSALSPFGVKGVGEAPIDGPAPSIVNALRHAGIGIQSIPATPERVLAAISRKQTVTR